MRVDERRYLIVGNEDIKLKASSRYLIVILGAELPQIFAEVYSLQLNIILFIFR